MAENENKIEPLNKNNKVPKLRFKEFTEEWEKVNFYNHFEKFSTNSLSWDELNFISGEILNLHYGIIHSSPDNVIQYNLLPYINLEKTPKNYTVIQEGDLILADTSEDRKDAAKGVEINNPFNKKIISGLHTIHLREKIPCTILGYKTYFVASKSFRKFSKKYCEGIKVFSIKQSLLKYAYFAYPKDITEQKKIVNIFNKINTKIEIFNEKISTLKKYKKGLQRLIFSKTNYKDFYRLKDIVKYEAKSKISAGSSIDNGKYVLYKSGQKNGLINKYSHEGIYIIANDGGEASFKLTNGKFAYTDHCICFKCKTDKETIALCNYLEMNTKKITYVGFIGTGIKNIDRQYLGMIKVPKLEYKKIAQTFLKISQAIEINITKLDKLKMIKKYLLNSLFI